MATPPVTPDTLLAEHLRTALATAPITYQNEDELQAAIATLLDLHPLEREVPLSDGRSRIDLLHTTLTSHHVHTTGIEVKINGSTATVLRQLDRYATCPELHALILITTKSAHHRIPNHIGARRIPLHLVSLIQNGL